MVAGSEDDHVVNPEDEGRPPCPLYAPRDVKAAHKMGRSLGTGCKSNSVWIIKKKPGIMLH
eukprot:1153043-Pelagomonas_calceolata.AAC.2